MQHAGPNVLRSQRSVALAGRTRLCAAPRRVWRRVASPVHEEVATDQAAVRQSLWKNLNDETATAPPGHPDSPHAGHGRVHAAAAAAVTAAITGSPAAAAGAQPGLARGDVVVGRIVSTGPKGARVALLAPHLQGLTG